MRSRLALLPLCCLLAAPAFAREAELNEPPEGFAALFNGEDLSGWIGMNLDPRKLREMSPADRSVFLKEQWVEVQKHWTVENGELVNDGHGPYLTTAQDYGDFELRLDYKTVAGADSGIYLRGVPQVQIWDSTDEAKFNLGADKGSGALWNNQTHERFPLALADKPFGEWNSFRIEMVGDTVTVHLNDQLVVNEVVMENYWDRANPIFPVGPIQLQTHGGEIRFRNVYLRKIDRRPPEAGHLAKDGTPFGDGWQPLSTNIETGKPVAAVPELHNFDLHALFRAEDGKPAEFAFRTQGDGAGPALVLSVSPETGVQLSERKEGEPHSVASTPAEASGLNAGDTNHLYLRAHEDGIQAWLNDTQVIDVLYPHGPQSGRFSLAGVNLESAFVRNTADDPRAEVSADESGFEPIFNGKDLAGWTGDVSGYAAEPGILKSTEKGGNLFFEQPLADFAFRFDFKLNEGGNNGVGIRIPKDATKTAYEGVESQILDNTSEQYADIAPYQAHGSIYGVLPAKRGYLAPTGHWNTQEIVVEGTKFKVTLNGKTIVDGDVKEASANGTPDHNEHPGLANTSGHLGFLGHGHVIEWRNLRVKRLNAE